MVCERTTWEVSFDRNKGFSATQKESIWAIKPKKTARPWTGIFRVLFPEDPESSYPHPCKFSCFILVVPLYTRNTLHDFTSCSGLTSHFVDHSNGPLVQFSHQLQEYWIQQSRIIVPQRLVNAPFLSNLSGRDPQDVSDCLVQFVNQLSVEIIQSFQRSLLQSIQRDEQPTASRPPDNETSSSQPATNITSVTPQLVGVSDGSAESPALGMDTMFSPVVNSAQHIDPLDPYITLLYYLGDIAPTHGIDVTWANNLNDYLRDYFSTNLSSSPEMNPQLLTPRSEGGNLPDAGGNAEEPPTPDPALHSEPIGSAQTLEGGWDIINA
jgi:hypothetical protein